jgi:hypothetical protein
MAKTCKSCGKEYKGEYCEHCGYGNPNLKTHAADKYKKSTTPVRFMTPEQKEEYYNELKKKREEETAGGRRKRNPKMFRLMIVMIIAAVLIVFGTLFGTGVIGFNEKSSDVVVKYLEAVNERDFDDYVSCFTKEMRKDYESDLAETGYTEEEYMEAFNADFAEEYGDDFTITYDILNEDTITEYSLDGYEEAYGTTPNITEACLVVTDVTFSGSNGSEQFRMNFYTGKVGRHWKLFNIEYDAGTITTDMEIDNPPESSDEEDEDSTADTADTEDTEDTEDEDTTD